MDVPKFLKSKRITIFYSKFVPFTFKMNTLTIEKNDR